MRVPSTKLLLAILAFAVGASQAQGDKLRSPWDERKIALTSVGYDCPAPPE
jgi:hypothetical protein